MHDIIIAVCVIVPAGLAWDAYKRGAALASARTLLADKTGELERAVLELQTKATRQRDEIIALQDGITEIHVGHLKDREMQLPLRVGTLEALVRGCNDATNAIGETVNKRIGAMDERVRLLADNVADFINKTQPELAGLLERETSSLAALMQGAKRGAGRPGSMRVPFGNIGATPIQQVGKTPSSEGG